MSRIKNIANIITYTRMLAALIMIIVVPMSGMFWVLYIYCFISDILDGYIARKKKIVSDKGAILDSIADTIFFCSVFISIVPTLVIPRWMICSIVIIALIRALSYIVGFIKFKSFTSLHTWLNKMTGFLLSISPILIIIINLNITGFIISVIALVSAIEELLIIVFSKELNRDIKYIYIKML